MITSQRLAHWKVFVIAIYALAALNVGFAHKPLRMEERSVAFDVAAFQLPDGTLPTLCLGQGDGVPLVADPAHCDACVLTVAAGLVRPFEYRREMPDFRVISHVPPGAHARDARILAAARSRAPPHPHIPT